MEEAEDTEEVETCVVGTPLMVVTLVTTSGEAVVEEVVEDGPSEVDVLVSVGPVVVDGGAVVEVDEVVLLAGAVDVVEDVEDVEDVDEVEVEEAGGSDVELGGSVLLEAAPAVACVAEPWVTEAPEVPAAAGAVGEGRISPTDRGSAVATTVAAST